MSIRSTDAPTSTRQFRHLWFRALSLIGLVLTWQIVSSLSGSRMLPAPTEVWQTLLNEAIAGDLFFHLGMTLYRVAVSFLIAMAIGTATGVIMGRNGLIDRLLDLWVIIGLNLPALVVMVLCYLWFGLTDIAAILAVAVNK